MKWSQLLIGIASIAVVVAAVALWMGRGPETTTVSTSRGGTGVRVPPIFSEAATRGAVAFNATCAACHGINGAGTDAGPPLVHRIYEPSHHSDYAFQIAVANGVRAHHWRFGDMPPQRGLTQAEVVDIIAYVRELQRENGIE